MPPSEADLRDDLKKGVKDLTGSLGIILLIIWLVFLGLLSTVVRRRGLISNVDDYLAAGRNVQVGLAIAAAMAIYVWSASVMGAAAGGYAFGATGTWAYGLGPSLGLCLLAIVAPRLRKLFPYGTTILQFVRERFDAKSHVVLMAMYVIFALVVLSVQLIGTGITVNVLSQGIVPFWVGPAVLSLGVVVYLWVAGLWSTLLADFMNCLVAVGLLLVIAVSLIAKLGGLGSIYAQITHQVAVSGQQYMLSMGEPRAIFLYVVPMLGWAVVSVIGQEYWQRIFAANPKVLKAVYWGSGAWFMTYTIITALLGLIGWGYGIKVNVPDEIFPAIMATHLPGLNWAFILVIYAAVTSTTAAYIFAIATTLVRDFYVEYINRNASDDQLSRISRWLVLLVAAGGFVLSLSQGQILNLVRILPLFLTSGVPVVLLGLYTRWISGHASFVAVLVGFVLSMYMATAGETMYTYALLASLGASGVIATVGSLFSRANYDFGRLLEVKPLGQKGEVNI